MAKVTDVNANIFTIQEFSFREADRSNPFGSVEVWGTKDFGFGPTPFSLFVDSDKLDSLLYFLNKGLYEPATMSAAKFFGSPDCYYSHNRKCLLIAEWMVEEHTRENACLPETEPLPPGMSEDDANWQLYQQWQRQQLQPSYC